MPWSTRPTPVPTRPVMAPLQPLHERSASTGPTKREPAVQARSCWPIHHDRPCRAQVGETLPTTAPAGNRLEHRRGPSSWRRSSPSYATTNSAITAGGQREWPPMPVMDGEPEPRRRRCGSGASVSRAAWGLGDAMHTAQRVRPIHATPQTSWAPRRLLGHLLVVAEAPTASSYPGSGSVPPTCPTRKQPAGNSGESRRASREHAGQHLAWSGGVRVRDLPN